MELNIIVVMVMAIIIIALLVAVVMLLKSNTTLRDNNENLEDAISTIHNSEKLPPLQTETSDTTGGYSVVYKSESQQGYAHNASGMPYDAKLKNRYKETGYATDDNGYFYEGEYAEYAYDGSHEDNLDDLVASNKEYYDKHYTREEVEEEKRKKQKRQEDITNALRKIKPLKKKNKRKEQKDKTDAADKTVDLEDVGKQEWFKGKHGLHNSSAETDEERNARELAENSLYEFGGDDMVVNSELPKEANESDITAVIDISSKTASEGEKKSRLSADRDEEKKSDVSATKEIKEGSESFANGDEELLNNREQNADDAQVATKNKNSNDIDADVQTNLNAVVENEENSNIASDDTRENEAKPGIKVEKNKTNGEGAANQDAQIENNKKKQDGIINTNGKSDKENKSRNIEEKKFDREALSNKGSSKKRVKEEINGQQRRTPEKKSNVRDELMALLHPELFEDGKPNSK